MSGHGEYTTVTRHASTTTESERTRLSVAPLPGKFSGVTIGDLRAFLDNATAAGLPDLAAVKIAPTVHGSTSTFQSWRVEASETFSPEDWVVIDQKYPRREDSRDLVERAAQVLKQARDECFAIPAEIPFRSTECDEIMSKAAQRVVELLGVR